jgi:tripartite-type tricarboxylate transporter receptor subunit TctC
MRRAQAAVQGQGFVASADLSTICQPSREGCMKNGRKRSFLAAIMRLAAVLLAGTLPSAEALPAEAWPWRTVKMVVPLGPASGADVTARLLADQLSRRWGQAVIVENRPGADGIVGVTAFLGGADDHALLFAPAGTFTASPLLHQNLTFRPDRLAPVARVTNTLIAVAVPASLKINSLAGLMTFVGAQPGRFHWASITGATDLVFSGFLRSAGLSMVRVPYRDGVVATNDLSEGRIEVYMSALASVLPLAASGKIRILALANRERAPAVADVPTVAEAGYPALQYDGLAGLFATAAMPAALRERIAGDVRAVVADPGLAARIAATGQVVSPGSPAEFAGSIAEQSAAFAAIAKSLALQPQP